MELLTGLYLYVGYLFTEWLTYRSLSASVCWPASWAHSSSPSPPRSLFFMLPDHEIFVNWTGFLTVPYRRGNGRTLLLIYL